MQGAWCYAGGAKKNGRLLRHDVLKDDMFWLLASEEARHSCDATVTVGDTSFDVHRVVLSHRSTVLKELLSEGTYVTFPPPELQTKLPHEVTPALFRMLLCYSYCGVFGVRKTNTVEEKETLQALSVVLEMPLLLEAYESFSIVETLRTRAVAKQWTEDVRRMFSDLEYADVILSCGTPLVTSQRLYGRDSPKHGGKDSIKSLWVEKDVAQAEAKRSIFANRALLAARSQHFAEMFTPGKWKQESVVVIDESIITYEILRGVYAFFATGNVAYLKEDEARMWIRIFGFIEASRYFNSDALSLYVEDFLSRLITTETVCPLWNTCADMNAEHVAESCKQFIIKNFDAVVASPCFFELKKTHFRDVLLTGEVVARTDVIVEAVLAWGRHQAKDPFASNESIRPAVYDLLPPSTFFNMATKQLVLGTSLSFLGCGMGRVPVPA